MTKSNDNLSARQNTILIVSAIWEVEIRSVQVVLRFYVLSDSAFQATYVHIREYLWTESQDFPCRSVFGRTRAYNAHYGFQVFNFL